MFIVFGFTNSHSVTRNRPDSYRDEDTRIFSPLLYLPIAIGMSYGTSFSDCKYKMQFLYYKFFVKKISLSFILLRHIKISAL
jgi:hypothetical protein